MILSTSDESDLEQLIDWQRRVVDSLRFGVLAGRAPAVTGDASKVLQQLLVWQQTATVRDGDA